MNSTLDNNNKSNAMGVIVKGIFESYMQILDPSKYPSDDPKRPEKNSPYAVGQSETYGNGNADFADILREYCDDEYNNSHVRSEDEKFLTALVRNFCISHGVEIEDRFGEGSIRKALSGKSDIFYSKAYMWIDLFSALDEKFGIFSKDGEDFDSFYRSYSFLYTQLNNTKLVPFYPRWISEIAAIYTVYMRETHVYYDDARKAMRLAYERGLSEKKETKPSFNTDTVREGVFSILKKADRVGERSDRATLERLCAYISEHPADFVDEYKREKSGAGESAQRYDSMPSTRYRRSYCAIGEMLDIIGDKNVFDLEFLQSEACKKFRNSSNYDTKDECIREIEYLIVQELSDACVRASDPKPKRDIVMEFMVGPYNRKLKRVGGEKTGPSFEKYSRTIAESNNGNELMSYYSKNDRYIPRPIPEVTDSVIRLLRLIMAMTDIYEQQAEPDIKRQLPPKALVSKINKRYGELGILSLPEYQVKFYTLKSLVDVATVRYIFRSDEERKANEKANENVYE